MADHRGGTIDWQARPSVAPVDLARLSSLIPGAPSVYLEFLPEMAGGEGALLTTAPITYLRLWSTARCTQANADYEVQRWLPGHWGIGDNGGGEMLAFDRSAPGWPLYAIPFIPMDVGDRIPVAHSFGEMLRRLGKRATGSVEWTRV